MAEGRIVWMNLRCRNASIGKRIPVLESVVSDPNSSMVDTLDSSIGCVCL